VVYAQLKYTWATGAHDESLNFLRQFSASLSRDLQTETTEHAQRAGVSKQKLDELSRLLARCYFKQGEWQVALKETWDEVRFLNSFATKSDSRFREM
jgi:serine/threonine-protein kinase mTOR